MKKRNTFPSVLKDKTRELLRELPREIAFTDIARDTKLSAQWIGMLSRDEILAPDVGRIETLYNYLNKSPLSI